MTLACWDPVKVRREVALLTTISYFDWLTTLTEHSVVYLTEGSTFPTHWYRMKAFDEAADFGWLKFCDVRICVCTM